MYSSNRGESDRTPWIPHEVPVSSYFSGSKAVMYPIPVPHGHFACFPGSKAVSSICESCVDKDLSKPSKEISINSAA